MLETLWRLPENLKESADGLPLATKLSDLFFEFPYDRVPNDPWWLQLALRPESMGFLLVFYLVSKPIFKNIATITGLGKNPRASWFLGSVAVHNCLLCAFSFVVMIRSWPTVIHHYQRYGAFDTYCDPNGTLWSETDFGAWCLIFYVSKYWEFVDTWILILKGKKPSFLQVYHHTGIAFFMWVGVVSQSSWLQAVVLLNSIIHTLMYAYFFLKTISPTTEIKAAKYLTRAQIGQFLLGTSYTAGVLWMGDTCDTQSSRFGLACIHLYTYGLIALFMAFAKKKYRKKD